MTQTSKTYNVIDGEPQHGKVTETVVTFDREDIIEAFIDAFLDSSISEPADTINLQDFKISVDDFLTHDDIIRVINTMEQNLIDDDYGSGKDYGLLDNILLDMIPEKAIIEFDSQIYR